MRYDAMLTDPGIQTAGHTGICGESRQLGPPPNPALQEISKTPFVPELLLALRIYVVPSSRSTEIKAVVIVRHRIFVAVLAVRVIHRSARYFDVLLRANERSRRRSTVQMAGS